MALVSPKTVQAELYDAVKQINTILADLNARLTEMEASEAKPTKKVANGK